MYDSSIQTGSGVPARTKTRMKNIFRYGTSVNNKVGEVEFNIYSQNRNLTITITITINTVPKHSQQQNKTVSK